MRRQLVFSTTIFRGGGTESLLGQFIMTRLIWRLYFLIFKQIIKTGFVCRATAGWTHQTTNNGPTTRQRIDPGQETVNAAGGVMARLEMNLEQRLSFTEKSTTKLNFFCQGSCGLPVRTRRAFLSKAGKRVSYRIWCDPPALYKQGVVTFVTGQVGMGYGRSTGKSANRQVAVGCTFFQDAFACAGGRGVGASAFGRTTVKTLSRGASRRSAHGGTGRGTV